MSQMKRLMLVVIGCLCVCGCGRTDDPRDKARESLRTHLEAVDSSLVVGSPMRFRLTMTSIGNEPIAYDFVSAEGTDSISVIGPDGTEIPYIQGPCQLMRLHDSLRSGESVVLFESLDVAECYLIVQPGTYKFQAKGGRAIPASNKISIEVGAGPVKPCHAILARLINILPRSDWQAVVGYPEKDEANKEQAIVLLQKSSWMKSEGPPRVQVRVSPYQVDQDSLRERFGSEYRIEFVGGTEWGDMCILGNSRAIEVWPGYKQAIVEALRKEHP